MICHEGRSPRDYRTSTWGTSGPDEILVRKRNELNGPRASTSPGGDSSGLYPIRCGTDPTRGGRERPTWRGRADERAVRWLRLSLPRKRGLGGAPPRLRRLRAPVLSILYLRARVRAQSGPDLVAPAWSRGRQAAHRRRPPGLI